MLVKSGLLARARHKLKRCCNGSFPTFQVVMRGELKLVNGNERFCLSPTAAIILNRV